MRHVPGAPIATAKLPPVSRIELSTMRQIVQPLRARAVDHRTRQTAPIMTAPAPVIGFGGFSGSTTSSIVTRL